MGELILLYFTFFKIGLFSFGGGYAILTMIQQEVVYKQAWLSSTEFVELIAISQVTPGPISINSATYVGYKVTGTVFGSFISSLGMISPSIIIIILFAIFFRKFKDSKLVKYLMEYLKYAVIGFILAAALLLINKDNFMDYYSYIIFLVSLLLLYKYDLNPILLTIISAIVGIVIY